MGSLAFAIVLVACGLEGSSLDSSPYALTAHLVKRSPQNNRATSRFITGNSQIDRARYLAAPATATPGPRTTSTQTTGSLVATLTSGRPLLVPPRPMVDPSLSSPSSAVNIIKCI